jgi:hypothetical protein
MTAPIVFSIYISWKLLDILATATRTDPLVFIAPFAGLACAAFGVWYY